MHHALRSHKFDFVLGSLRVLDQPNIGLCRLLFYTVLHEALRW